MRTRIKAVGPHNEARGIRARLKPLATALAVALASAYAAIGPHPWAIADDRECIRTGLAQVGSPTRPRAELGSLVQAFDKSVKREIKLTAPNGDDLSLGARLERGDAHARVLTELGWTVHRNETGSAYLVPPDLDTLVTRYNARIEGNIRSGSLREQDAIYLSALYQATDAGEGARKFKLVRLGIDPPLEQTGWKLVSQGTEALDSTEWARALADGKMPVQFEMLAHEGAHITELAESPALMKAYRDMYRRVISEDWPLDERSSYYPHERGYKPLFERWGLQRKPKRNASSRVMHERVFTLVEWLSLPDISKTSEIENLIPHYFGKNPPTVRKNIRALKKLGPAEVASRAQRLVDAGDAILLRQGGGLRDPYNLERYGYRNAKSWVKREMEQLGGIDFRMSGPETVLSAAETLHSLLHQISLLKSGIDDPKALRRMLGESRSAYRPDDELRSRARDLLADRVARYEAALHAAVKYRITPVKVIEQAGQRAIDPKSDTYKYFSAFAPEESFTHTTFVR